MEKIRILVVEDDREIGQLIKRYLQKEGYVVEWVDNGKEAFARFFSKSFHFVILDLMLPQMDGLEVLRRIRKKENVPVLILSAKGEESDKVLGLGLGADDYLTKPFLMGELIARVKAQLRRYLYLSNPSKEELQVLTYNDLTLNLNTYEVKIGTESKPLTAKEFAILKLLMSQPKRVFTKAQIFESVWGEDYVADDNTVMVHIRRLRSKIESDPSHPQYIQTVWGIGYKLGDESD